MTTRFKIQFLILLGKNLQSSVIFSKFEKDIMADSRNSSSITSLFNNIISWQKYSETESLNARKRNHFESIHKESNLYRMSRTMNKRSTFEIVQKAKENWIKIYKASFLCQARFIYRSFYSH